METRRRGELACKPHLQTNDVVVFLKESLLANALVSGDRRKDTGTLVLTTTGRRFKATVVLVDGVIVAAEVPWASRDIAGAVLPLFLGRYRMAFLRGVCQRGSKFVHGSVDPLEMIVRSLVKYICPEVIDKMLGDVGYDTRLFFVGSVSSKRLRFNARTEGLLLWIAHRPTSLNELTRQITCSPQMIRRLVYFLIITGVLAPKQNKLKECKVDEVTTTFSNPRFRQVRKDSELGKILS